jgi:hypothetical protein
MIHQALCAFGDPFDRDINTIDTVDHRSTVPFKPGKSALLSINGSIVCDLKGGVCVCSDSCVLCQSLLALSRPLCNRVMPCHFRVALEQLSRHCMTVTIPASAIGCSLGFWKTNIAIGFDCNSIAQLDAHACGLSASDGNQWDSGLFRLNTI